MNFYKYYKKCFKKLVQQMFHQKVYRLHQKLKFEHYNEEDLRDILNQITDLEFSDDAITYLATRTNQFRKIVQTLEQLEKQAKTNQFNIITEDILKGRFNERQSIKIMPAAQKMYA